jgi:hypothetical protein
MKIPYLIGEYVHVYQPEPDIFHGPDSPSYRTGQRYEEWVPNDFTIVHDGHCWHLIGITHPCPPWFKDVKSDQLGMGNIHEAEWQLFHAVSRGKTLKDSLVSGGFTQKAQILPAPERPDEIHEIWAPICWKRDDLYYLLYAPTPMRLATSKDLYSWKLCGEAFVCNHPSARDPNIMEENGRYTVVYIQESTLYIRESYDLRTYSEPSVLFDGPQGVSLESPILKYINGLYYLIYCIYNHRDRINGSYDYRTYVHAAKTIKGLYDSPKLATLRAHAPELFQDEQGDWYLASAEWPNRGISIAPMGWKEYNPNEKLEF